MRLITIENMGEVIAASDGADRRHRREWTVTGQVDIYLKGNFDDKQYETARMLAFNLLIDMHIPVRMLRRVMPEAARKGRKVDPGQKSMF